MNIKHVLKSAGATAAVASACLMAGPAQAQESLNVTFVSGYAPSFSWTKAFVEKFVPAVDEKLAETGNYKINWNLAHSGTVVKPRGELEGVQTGLGQIGIVVTAFHADRVPLYNVAYVTPFSTADIHFLQGVYHKMQDQFADAFRKDWNALGQVALFEGATAPMDTYWVVSRPELTSIDQLDGMKVSAAGPNLPWVTSLGAAGINSAATDWFQQLNTGLAEAVLAWPDVTGSQKLCEPAKNVMHANIGGVVAHILSVNQRFFDNAPDEVRQAFMDAAPQYAEYQADAVLAGTEKQTKYCVEEEGMNIVELSAEERARWADALPPLGLDWAKSLDDRGRPGSELLSFYMDEMRAGGSPARDWDKE